MLTARGWETTWKEGPPRQVHMLPQRKRMYPQRQRLLEEAMQDEERLGVIAEIGKREVRWEHPIFKYRRKMGNGGLMRIAGK